MQITNCARRKSCQVAFGQGFDSPQLHQNEKSFRKEWLFVLPEMRGARSPAGFDRPNLPREARRLHLMQPFWRSQKRFETARSQRSWRSTDCIFAVRKRRFFCMKCRKQKKMQSVRRRQSCRSIPLSSTTQKGPPGGRVFLYGCAEGREKAYRFSAAYPSAA